MYLCYQLHAKKEIMGRSVGKTFYSYFFTFCFIFIYLCFVIFLTREKKVHAELKFPSINQLKREKLNTRKNKNTLPQTVHQHTP